MPIWADPRRGEQVRLVADDDMTLLATFVAPPAPRPTASDLRALPGTDLARLAAVCARDLPGVRIVTDLAEAAALAEVGAVVVRTHAHLLRDLTDPPPPIEWAAPRLPAGLALVGPASMGAPEAVAAALAPLAPEPDELAGVLDGSRLGVVDDDASAVVVTASGRPVGALLVTELPPIAGLWPGGRWVAELFRARSLGPAPIGVLALRRAMAVCELSGVRRMGAAVDQANPAKRLFERLGFQEAAHRVTLDLPGAWPGTR